MWPPSRQEEHLFNLEGFNPNRPPPPAAQWSHSPKAVPGLREAVRAGGQVSAFLHIKERIRPCRKVAGFVQRSVSLSGVCLSSFTLPLTRWGGPSPDFFSTLASSSVLFCFFKPLCPAPIMESAVYVQGPLKRQLTAPWLRSSLLVSLATGGRENRTCQMENVSYSRSGERKEEVGPREGRGEEGRGKGGRAGGDLGLTLPPPQEGAGAQAS